MLEHAPHACVHACTLSLPRVLHQVMGREVIKPDGVFGPRTKQAFIDFQSQFGMPLGGDVTEQLKTVADVMRKAARHGAAPPAGEALGGGRGGGGRAHAASSR